MKITIDGVNIRDLKVVMDEHGWLREILWCDDEVESYLVDRYSSGKTSDVNLEKLFDLDICGTNEVLEKYHVSSNLNYERFTRGIKLLKH